MSIRLRLTLLYSAILALTLLAFSASLYAAQSRLTYDGIKADLMRQAAPLAGGPRPFPSPRDAPPMESQPGSSQPGGPLPGRWTQIRTVDGRVTASSRDLGDTTLPLSSQGLDAVRNGRDWFETALVQDEPLLIYSRSIAPEMSSNEIVQVAFPITQPQQALNTLRLSLLIGSSLVIAAAFAIGWILAGTSLRPIGQITHTAQAIGAERNFSRRVAHTGPNDEIGYLATTFNTMLAELESAYRQLERALESQRRFAADASHELRTPLTTVRGNIELLRREPPVDAAERADILADTTNEVDRLIRLVNQLLVLARADAGQKRQRLALPLRPLMDDVMRQAKLLAPQADILCDSPAGALVLADSDALKQVLLILVDNALAHTLPGTRIWLAAAVTDGHVAISVRDAGPGIPPDVLPHIFERFYRGQVSRTGNRTGLGLAIARGLVEAQGGSIAASSQVGQGSVFTVSLPQAPPRSSSLA
jgi:two-component system, OmpR family, sensor kinase